MRSIVIGTAGHIDHGKSALVLALTGTDPDRLKEEKARGITIDLGFTHLELAGCNFAFVDVPGHERFVRNMLAGAGGVDAVMLVVAADESIMPQTREHFEICSLLGVKSGIVAITKSDLVDEDTLALCRLEVRDLVEGSFLDDAPVVAVSARTGAGLEDLREELGRLPTRMPARSVQGPPRLPVDRAFSMKGFGTVVTGTLVSGTIRPEDSLVMLPSATPVKVRGIQVHGQACPAAVAGQRTALNIGGVDVSDVSRGEVLCGAGTLEPTRRADVRLALLDDQKPLKHGARVRFHQGTSELLARVARSSDPRYARIRFERAAVLTRGDRFILRAYSPPVTIGGGTVLDPQPPRTGVRTPAGRARFERLDSADAAAAASVFVEEKGVEGLPASTLISRAGLDGESAEAVRQLLRDTTVSVDVADRLVARSAISERAAALLEAVSRHHDEQPLATGLPREEARRRLFGRAPLEVFDHVVLSLERQGRLTARDTLAMPGRLPSLSAEEARARDLLMTAFKTAGLAPPDVRAAAAGAAVPPAVADRVIKLLIREKALVRLDELVFHPDALDGLRSDVGALKAAGQTRLDVGVFKERYGVTRKFAIPLLEYLDRERITRRMGDARVIL